MPMSKEKTQLEKVFCHSWFKIGYENVIKIYIITDGHGPMGFYDRVHVIKCDGLEFEANLIFPAHHCEQMELLNVKEYLK